MLGGSLVTQALRSVRSYFDGAVQFLADSSTSNGLLICGWVLVLGC